MAREVPDELVDDMVAAWHDAPRNERGLILLDDHMRFIAAAVVGRHEQMVLQRASEKLMALAAECGDALTGPRAARRRALESAARHILPPITPEQLAEAIADGSAVVMRCQALDEEGQ